jgi:hypothetical protein
LTPESFDDVYSAGVLHHTAGYRQRRSRQSLDLPPGRIVIVGLYNAFARLPLRFREGIARLTGFRVIRLNPSLRERRQSRRGRAAWLRDQYQHP